MTTMELTILAAFAVVILLLIVGLVLWQKHFTSQQDTLQNVAKILEEIDRTLKTFDTNQPLPEEAVLETEIGQQEPAPEETAETGAAEQVQLADADDSSQEALPEQEEQAGKQEDGELQLEEASEQSVQQDPVEMAEAADAAGQQEEPEQLENSEDQQASERIEEEPIQEGTELEQQEPIEAGSVDEASPEKEEETPEELCEQKEDASAEAELLTKKLAAELEELQELQRSQKELTTLESRENDQDKKETAEDETEMPEDVSSAEEMGMESKDISQLLAAASEETEKTPAISEMDMGRRIHESAIYNVGKSGKAYTEEELEKLIRE